MTADHNCEFQVTIFDDHNPMLISQWSSDREAVVELLEEINRRGSRSLSCHVDIHDFHRSILIIQKNGHTLFESEPFDVKPIDEKVRRVIYLLQRKSPHLRAAPVTRGNGGVMLGDSAVIGG